MYRFEVKSVLGKGSFAQVVCAFDHKFAEAEAKLLMQLMKDDPHDSYNIVRLKEHL